MNNTYNNSEDDTDVVLEIAPQTLAALSKPQVDGSEYWNLNSTTFGSAGFKAAWGLATGAGVTISIVDEGVNYTHLDLADSYDRSIDYDPLDAGDSDARPDSASEQHGTEVAVIQWIVVDAALVTVGKVEMCVIDALIDDADRHAGASRQTPGRLEAG